MRRISEWVAHTEIKGGITPLEVTYPPLARGPVGVVELYAPIESEDYKLQIDPYAEACIEAELLIEPVEFECLIGVIGGFGQFPDIAKIEE